MRAKIRQGAPDHTCHAQGCNVVVPERMFMCLRHWRMLPGRLRRGINLTYVSGQEIRKDPSLDYLEAAEEAITWLAEKERNKK